MGTHLASHPNTLAALVVACVLAVVAPVHAQTFSELERTAAEAPEDLVTWAGPLLTDCRARAGAAERQCVASRRRAAASQLRGTYIVDLPAAGRASVSPYEAHNNGFRIRFPGLAFTRPGTPGVVSTAPFVRGAMSPHLLAEGFAPVSREAAGRFRAGNAITNLRVRVVFRVGADWVDAAATDPARGFGVTLEVLGAQVYNEQTGSVLADSRFSPSVGGGAPMLMSRLVLWNRESRGEAVWLAPNGETVLFHTRIEPVANQPGTLETTVFTTHAASPVEVVRFVAPCCSATVDLAPHGAGVLMIITEVASTRGSTGRGRVLFLRWVAEQNRFEIAARWEGDNRSEPPAWLRDPAAIPESSSGAVTEPVAPTPSETPSSTGPAADVPS